MNNRIMLENKSNPLLKVKNLSKTVTSPGGELTLLQAMDFTINRGESVAIVGPSGAGKSTLLGILAGLDTPSTGEVNWLEQNIFALDEDGRAQLRGRMAGFVFQSFQLLPSLTAIENVMLPLELLRVDNPRETAQEILSKVALAERCDHYPRQLSGGEQQRVAIARAFVVRPKLLFADEPTGNLDSVTGGKIIDLLFEMNQAQNTVLILVTHDKSLADRCYRRLQIDVGKLTELVETIGQADS